MQDMWKGVFVSVGPQAPQQESQQGATIRFCCVFNRPGVAGAALKTASSLTDSVSQ